MKRLLMALKLARLLGLTALICIAPLAARADGLGLKLTIPDTAAQASVCGGCPPYWINFHHGALPHFKAAVAATLAGTADTLVAMIGDSTTKGTNASSWTTTYPNVLATDFTAAGYPSQSQAAFSQVDAPDSRLSFGASWTGGPVSIGGPLNEGSSTTTAATFTPTIALDSFTVYYFNNGGGPLTVLVDGSSVGSIPDSSASSLITAQLFSATLGTHALGIQNGTGSTTTFFPGWDVFDSTTRRVHFLNLGVSGYNTSQWSGQVAGYTPLNATLKLTPAPALWIINLGINDWLQQNTAAAFGASYQSIINAGQAAGVDMVLVGPVPSSTGSGGVALQYQQAITQEIYALAKSNNLIGIDMTAYWGSYAAVCQAYYGACASAIHPADGGYASEAAVISTFLQAAIR